MRLVFKLAAGLLVGIFLVLAVHGFFTAQREVQTFDADKRREAHLLGHALVAAFTATWSASGEARALALLAEIDAQDRDLAVRWIAPDQLRGRPQLQPLLDARLVARGDMSFSIRQRKLHTFVPATVGKGNVGAIELVTSLAEKDAYVRSTVWRLSFALVAMLAIKLGLAVALGNHWVGRPIRKLVARARSVGQGDLETPLDLRSKDELGDLAREINAMTAQLAAQRARTEQEQRERLAAEAQLRHSERLATVGKLAAGIAHEIGTPLNVADGHAKMIVAGQVQGQEARESAQVICRQTGRITDLLRRLMHFARRRAPDRAPVELLRLVLDTASLLASLAEKSGGKIAVAPSASASALADSNQIQQVLTNLITNAIDAMPGGGTVSLAVRAEHAQPPASSEAQPGDYCCILVEDQGQGIAAADLPHVFDPFFTTKDVGQGTGLGLSIAHGIVREHGGWIDVQSEVGRGSRFAVYLPRAS